MKSPRPLPILAVGLCVLALFVAQAFGKGALFLCLCGGQPIVAQTSHCHGPHGADCHSAEAETGRAPHDEERGDREEHRVVSHESLARLDAAAAPLAVPPTCVALLPFWESPLARAKNSARPPTAAAESPPRGVAVARTVVLRI